MVTMTFLDIYPIDKAIIAAVIFGSFNSKMKNDCLKYGLLGNSCANNRGFILKKFK